MKLIHYTFKKVDFDLNRQYDNDDGSSEPKMKPSGLWVSVEGEGDWKEWCEDVGWEGRLTHAYHVKVKGDANILHLRSPQELMEFTKKYPCVHPKLEPYPNLGGMYLNWSKVKHDYQGLIISPYQCSQRLDLMWYYGWDCASGCIWDLSCVEEFELMNEEALKAVEAV